MPQDIAILTGGSVALMRCVSALEEQKPAVDQAVGVGIVKRALEERGGERPRSTAT